MTHRIGLAALVALPAGWWGGHALVGLVAFAAVMVLIGLVDLGRVAFGRWPTDD